MENEILSEDSRAFELIIFLFSSQTNEPTSTSGRTPTSSSSPNIFSTTTCRSPASAMGWKSPPGPIVSWGGAWPPCPSASSTWRFAEVPSSTNPAWSTATSSVDAPSTTMDTISESLSNFWLTRKLPVFSLSEPGRRSAGQSLENDCHSLRIVKATQVRNPRNRMPRFHQ